MKALPAILVEINSLGGDLACKKYKKERDQ